MTKLQVWDRIFGLFNGIEQRLSEELRKAFDLGINEFRTLQRLIERPELEIRMLELSEILQLTQSSTTRLVERLERKGFVYRDTCPSDGRGKFCVITDAGESYIRRAMPEFEMTLNRVLDEIFESKEAQTAAREFGEFAPA